MKYIYANTARNMTINGGTGHTMYNPDRPNEPTYPIIMDAIEKAANDGFSSISINVKKYNYQSFASMMRGYQYQVRMPQADVEAGLGMKSIENIEDPYLVKYTPTDTVVVEVSWK